MNAISCLPQHHSPTLVATHSFVNPLVAVLVGWLLASEAMSLRLVAAIILIQRGDRPVKRRTMTGRSD